MQRERIFHYARHDKLLDWVRLGWIVAKPNCEMHHDFYNVTVEFLCNCKEPPIPHEEEWRDIPGYEGLYQASTLGRVRSLDRVIVRAGRGYPRTHQGMVLKSAVSGAGYESVALSTADAVVKRRYVAHLVAETFLGPRPEGTHVCHNDGTRNNNRLKNLRYDTPKENSADKFRHGTMKRGEDCYQSRLTEADVREIRLAATREDYRVIAEKYGITYGAVSDIAQRLSWKHLPAGPGEVGTPEGDALRKKSWSERRAAWVTGQNKLRAGAA